MLCLSHAATAFSPLGVASTTPLSVNSNTMMAATERSAALPFLKKPPALDGSMAGDVGFDPLGFSTTVTELGGDLNYVREAELMHGRQAMLASVGMIFPAIFGKLDVDWAAEVSTNPIVAQYQLPDQIYWQLFGSMAIAEGIRASKVYSDAPPGEHGFDPLGLIARYCDTPEKMMDMKTKEIKNGRLAMIAVTGMWFQLMIKGSVWPLI